MYAADFGTGLLGIVGTETQMRSGGESKYDVRKFSVGIRLGFEIFLGVANASFVNELLISIKR